MRLKKSHKEKSALRAVRMRIMLIMSIFSDSSLDCLPRGGRILPRWIRSTEQCRADHRKHNCRGLTALQQRTRSIAEGSRISFVHISRWPKADHWYLGVRCRKCRMPILFALDRREGEGGCARLPSWKTRADLPIGHLQTSSGLYCLTRLALS